MKKKPAFQSVIDDRSVIFFLIALAFVMQTLMFIYVNIKMEEVLYISTTYKIISF
jgi:hypothetical protein